MEKFSIDGFRREKLSLDKIKLDAQVRVEINQEIVEQYAEAMQDGVVFPSIKVFHDGTDYHLADGYHRVAAARKCGFLEIQSIVETGAAFDALWFALTANQAHGLRMNRADMRHAIGLALKNFPVKSNRELARQIGCSHVTVADERTALESSGQIDQLRKTTGADGKARPAKWQSKAKPDLPVEDEPAAVVQADEKPLEDEDPAAEVTGPTYLVRVRARNVGTVKKRLAAAFGPAALVSVEKESFPTSRAARLDRAAGQVEDARSTVEELLGEIEGWRDNQPDNLQGSEKADQLSECANGLQTILDALGELDFQSIEFPGAFGA
jgi:ParB-like chromosome segregation protein Spo0J